MVKRFLQNIFDSEFFINKKYTIETKSKRKTYKKSIRVLSRNLFSKQTLKEVAYNQPNRENSSSNEMKQREIIENVLFFIYRVVWESCSVQQKNLFAMKIL